MRLKNRFNALKDYQIYELQNKFIVMNVYCAKGLFLRLEHVTKQPITCNLRLSTAQLSSPIAEIPQGFRFFSSTWMLHAKQVKAEQVAQW